MTDNNEYSGDQTQFSIEEPLLERQVKPVVEKKVEPTTDSDAASVAEKSQKLLFVAVGLALFIFIILILLIVTLNRSNTSGIEPSLELDTMPEQISGPFTQKINDLEKELQASDPSQEELPLPPVDMNIRLE